MTDFIAKTADRIDREWAGDPLRPSKTIEAGIRAALDHVEQMVREQVLLLEDGPYHQKYASGQLLRLADQLAALKGRRGDD